MLKKEFKNNKDIEVVTDNGVESPIILTWPHNGTYVPSDLHMNGLPLGLPVSYFDKNSKDRRHEVADWGMDDLLESVKAQDNGKVRHIVSNYSRKVADNNRIEEFAITDRSADTGHITPANFNLSAEEKQERVAKYHTPYRDAVNKAIKEAKEKFGYTVVIDMHSFTPKFKGEQRSVELGTFKPKASKLSHIVEHLLSRNTFAHFKADSPYDVTITEDNNSPYVTTNAGQYFARENDIDYIGIEIRNDLLDLPHTRELIAELIIKTALTAGTHLNPQHTLQADDQFVIAVPAALSAAGHG